MPTFKRYTPDNIHQWNDFVKTSKNGFFMFDRAYMDYHADRFTDHSLMVFDEGGSLVAMLPANERDGVLYTHQGLTFGGFIVGRKMRTPLMLEVMEGLKAYAKAEGFTKVVYKAIPHFYHQQPAQEDLYAFFRQGAKQVRVDVSSTIDYATKRYKFSSSRKSGLVKAKKEGLTVQAGLDFTAFFNMMNEVLAEKYDTQATHTADEMTKLQTSFPNNIKGYACTRGNELLAGAIVYETETVAHTQYLAATEEGRSVGALDLLLKHLIDNVYTGKNYFDFGISTEQAGQYLNEGLIDQKEGTGARATIHQVYELEC